MRAPALAATALALVLPLTGCGGDDPKPEEEAGASTSPSASEENSPSEPTSEPAATDCPEGAACDDFADPSSGWTAENTEGYFAEYADYQGGSFRVGTRVGPAYAAQSPFQVSDLVPDYGITVDVDATRGEGVPDTGAFGVTCWNQPTSEGTGVAGFLLFVDGSSASIGLWDQFAGEYVEIERKPVTLDPGTTHLTASCTQGANGIADLSLAVNGTEAVTASYSNSAQNTGWKASDGVGVVVAGEGTDVFFDDFVVAPAG